MTNLDDANWYIVLNNFVFFNCILAFFNPYLLSHYLMCL